MMDIQRLFSILILIFVVSLKQLCTAQTCPQLQSPRFGTMRCSGIQGNDRCVVQCNPGYDLTISSSSTRICVCLDARSCVWSGQRAFCKINTASCPSPTLTGNTYSVVDVAPQGAVLKITITPTSKANAGWSVIVIFSTALSVGMQVRSYSMLMSAISPDRKAVTFRSRAYNEDISNRQIYAATFLIESINSDLSPQVLPALVGFYDTPIYDGSCFGQVNPLSTSAVPTTAAATTIVTTTAVTSAPDRLSTSAATAEPSGNIPKGCKEIEYSIDNHGWNAPNGWNFIFRYRAPIEDYENWIIKIEFSTAVAEVTAYDSIADGPFREGRIWLLRPRSWNAAIKNQQMDAIGMSVSSGRSAPNGFAIICNNGVVPGKELRVESGSTSTTTFPMTTTISTVSVMNTTMNTLNPNGPSGVLPKSPRQSTPSFTPSTSPGDYDFNELLHKSILFYEAQRSGKLPGNNRIPWRGDSALKDGCMNGVCEVDLTGGWYDAGDFMKFGFPMSWSVTVLAWGMIEFENGYRDAGEWNNALSMLRWATDYLVKAHVSPNELYFQVGDPKKDHTNWGHPETMTMERPIFKIDTSNPGSEVAAETAAALAASSIVFKNVNSAYSNNLLSHAIQLHNFAQTYRGHYHISVPESGVGEFYRSYSGYDDELMWSAMWLFKATGNRRYLGDAIQQVNYISNAEFSWDQKGPGALVLLSQERSEYKSNLIAGINFVMSKKKTPGGLVHFSDWGSNRYAANYAFIALLTAKMEGVSSTSGRQYYSFAKDQISRMLGRGGGQRSYVVGFGVNPPQQPHHRASSCRAWTSDPSTQTCDWSDRDANRPNPYTLYGALVGGPTSSGYYVDDRKSYVSNEVALDYNAGFQSAIAGLKFFQAAGVSL